MISIQSLFKNNFAFYSFLGITYILVFSGVNYSVAALSDIQKLKNVKEEVLAQNEETEQTIAALSLRQKDQVAELKDIESRIAKAIRKPLTFEEVVKKRLWGRDEIHIFCHELIKLNPGFKCPEMPDP